ncbi:MAG: HlyD family efflux transporter periplasmic adaptor subunit [Bacillota bacterium]
MPDEEKKAPQKKIRPLFAKTILFIAGAFIIYITAVNIWNYARLNLTKTETLMPGELKRLYPAEAVLIRDETVIPAPADGEFVLSVTPGQRVRAGDIIAGVRTTGKGPGLPAGSVSVKAVRSGVVSLNVDGMEGVLKPEQVDALDLDNLDGAGNAGRAGPKGPIICSVGQPVVKIIDNLAPLLVCLRVPPDFPAERIKKGGAIQMTWQGGEFQGRIEEVGSSPEGVRLVIEIRNYPQGLLEVRKTTLNLVGGKLSGYIVDKGAIVPRDGQDGLYIVSKKDYMWVPVKVEGVVDNSAAVTGERLSAGAFYIINP